MKIHWTYLILLAILPRAQASPVVQGNFQGISQSPQYLTNLWSGSSIGLSQGSNYQVVLGSLQSPTSNSTLSLQPAKPKPRSHHSCQSRGIYQLNGQRVSQFDQPFSFQCQP